MATHLEVAGKRTVRAPLASIIVVNWNGMSFLQGCLSSLMNQTMSNYEVIMVDNSSTDGSVDYVTQRFTDEISKKRLRIIRLPRNYEFAKGNNVGFEQAKGKFVLTINNDAQVPSDFLEKMLDVVVDRPHIGAVGCKIATQGNIRSYCSVFVKKLMINGPSELEILDRPVYCLAPCGAAALYRRELIHRLGGFDPDYVSDWEDHDFGYRVWITGYACAHTPDVTITHYGAGSYGPVSGYRKRRITRNMLLTYFKNLSDASFSPRFSYVAYRILSSSTPVMAILKLLSLEVRPNTMKQVTQTTKNLAAGSMQSTLGVVDFLRSRSLFRQKRTNIQAMRRMSDDRIFQLTQGDRQWK
mgnify:CR=1 FL=1